VDLLSNWFRETDLVKRHGTALIAILLFALASVALARRNILLRAAKSKTKV
jgi:hypothetical protein